MKMIIKSHKGMNREVQFIEGIVKKPYITEVNHTIDYNENEIIITAAVKMNLKDPRCKKILEKMEQKQVSPVREILGQLETSNRRDLKYEENATHNLYSIPSDLIDKIL